MAELDLRPLSLGELLDRTFALYRRHFVLFVGITAIPQLLTLAFQLFGAIGSAAQGTVVIGVQPQVATRSAAGAVSPLYFLAFFVGLIIYLIVYLFAQGGTFFAVSETYLGRATTIGASLGRMWGNVLKLLGVTILNGLVVFAAFILLIIPGIYVSCRLLVCVPAALLEDLGPGESLSRSFELTRNEAGKAFVILLLYVVLIFVALMLFQFPFNLIAQLTAHNLGATRPWIILGHVGSFLATVLVTPYLTIATAVFYYDLRVKKEAFDLQMMMNPGTPLNPAAPGAPATPA
jgi:hypothetical protein